MDEAATHERMLDQMLDPVQIAKREREKKEKLRVATIRNRLAI
jgi:hypothetical protein